ncbi:hypothetical protein GCM10010207_64950 [Streptomyces atratus]|uniref:hypothetical protein n=1 Tax=Streptomyces atratus TaxID=1893 RepID=UPI00130027FC|nr:hypothetical protein [Streptomyces atratus]GGT55900.1 hypothetical protein GCM10010207_64950 [Streptomyces atratus]
MTTTRVELRIRRLVLDSTTRPSRAALCVAIEAELAVLLGLSPADGSRGRAGRPAVPADSGAAALGLHIARAVHRALGAEETAGPRPKAGDHTS